MEAGIFAGTNELLPSDGLPAATARPSLSIDEFLQLGLFRVAYLTRVEGPDGAIDIVIHGADGMAVEAADTAEMATDQADQLGLMLVPVH